MMNLNKNTGFSLIEVLIAFVILVVGLLGATTLVIRSSQINMNAYETEQITLLATTFVEKIRANPNAINTYIDNKSGQSNVSDCVAKDKTCSKEDRALTDMFRFQEQIGKLTVKDVDWTIEKNSTTTLKGSDNGLYQLKLTWGPESNGVPSNAYYLNFVLRTQSSPTTP